MRSPHKRSLDRVLCRHAFDDAVVATARLAAFSTSRSLKSIGHGEYYNISSDLCKKDLLIAAISIRKLAELTNTTSALKSKQIRFFDSKKQKESAQSISSWDLIGNIIHGIELEIVKDTMFLLSFTDILEAINNTEEIDAIVIIKSDKFPRKLFQLNDFISHLNDYTEEANEEMASNGVFLGSLYE